MIALLIDVLRALGAGLHRGAGLGALALFAVLLFGFASVASLGTAGIVLAVVATIALRALSRSYGYLLE